MSTGGAGNTATISARAEELINDAAWPLVESCRALGLMAAAEMSARAVLDELRLTAPPDTPPPSDRQAFLAHVRTLRDDCATKHGGRYVDGRIDALDEVLEYLESAPAQTAEEGQ